jgi:hypothetical protein
MSSSAECSVSPDHAFLRENSPHYGDGGGVGGVHAAADEGMGTEGAGLRVGGVGGVVQQADVERLSWGERLQGSV